MKPIRKALLVDDEPAIRRLLQTALESQGVEVTEAATGKEAIAQAIATRPDFILLDLGLPDIDGLEVLKELRRWFTKPVLILSVRDEEDGIVAALDAGADDYLTKPFHVSELLARIRTAERHVRTTNAVTLGSVRIDFDTRSVLRDGKEVHLTATEYDVFKVLAENVGRVLTHRQLLHQVWGPNSAEHVQYLRVYVGHLRQKLEADPNNPKLVVTEPGVGYRLVGGA